MLAPFVILIYRVDLLWEELENTARKSYSTKNLSSICLMFDHPTMYGSHLCWNATAKGDAWYLEFGFAKTL